jgi:hypothetical protein
MGNDYYCESILSGHVLLQVVAETQLGQPRLARLGAYERQVFSVRLGHPIGGRQEVPK